MKKVFILIFIVYSFINAELFSQENEIATVTIDSITYIPEEGVLILKIRFVNHANHEEFIYNPDFFLLSKYLFWIPSGWDIIIKTGERQCITEGHILSVFKDTEGMIRKIDKESSYLFDIPIKVDKLNCGEKFSLDDDFHFSIQLKMDLVNPAIDEILSNQIEFDIKKD